MPILVRARVPVTILLIGIALTAIMASFQQDSARREQELLFERQVTKEQQNFHDHIDQHIDTFEDAVAFVSATFPGTQQQYRRFFEGSTLTGGNSALDPGITLLEPVRPDEVEALEARERSLGNANFEVLSLGDPLGGTHYVITRTAEPVSISGFPLVGLDIGSVASDALLADLPDNGRVIYTLREETILQSMFSSGSIGDGLQLVVMLESVNDPLTGEVRGWAARFFDPLLFVSDLGTNAGSINVDVEMLGIRETLIDANPDTSSLPGEASLARRIDNETHGLGWSLTLWADDDFGVKTGLLDQTEVWLFGLLSTMAFVIVSMWRKLQSNQLTRANFELEHARTLANTDPLTGLLNRQGFLELANRLENTEGGTLFFIDLDGFKAVNDSQGHAAGDKVLRDVARHLREQFRNMDLVCRFGGDEFVIFTPGLAGRGIETGISQRVIDAIGRSNSAISCSLGTAVQMPNTPPDIKALISEADRAMYRAKQSGGGRHVAATPMRPLPAGSTIDLGDSA